MELNLTLNGKKIKEQIADDMLLLDFVREHGCYSVKRGCETSNCGLCTVLVDGKPVLSCSLLAARANGKNVETLESLQKELDEYAQAIADQGAEQCGFCNPGMLVNLAGLLRTNPDPSEEQVRVWLAGNLCRCSGYVGQQRGIHNILKAHRQKKLEEENQKSNLVNTEGGQA
jgi:carbon-monoxide dehydrogenase small subunit